MIILVDLNSRIIMTSNSYKETNVHYIINDCGFMKDRVCVYSVENVPDGAKYYKEGKFSAISFEEVENNANSIQNQLDELDKKSVRDAEDLHDLLLKKGIITDAETPFIKQRKDQKKALRQQLIHL